jgi:hypothetical protein
MVLEGIISKRRWPYAPGNRGLWQRASGYNWRALVEADIGRYKRVIGDAPRSRTDGRQTTEVAIAVASLNRMLELGRSEYVRLSSISPHPPRVSCVYLILFGSGFAG